LKPAQWYKNLKTASYVVMCSWLHNLNSFSWWCKIALVISKGSGKCHQSSMTSAVFVPKQHHKTFNVIF